MWTERRNKKEPRTRSAVEQMGFPVSGCGTRGFAAQTVLARDDTEKSHLLPTAPAIVRPANTPPLGVADLRSRFDNDLFFSNRFELAELEKIENYHFAVNWLTLGILKTSFRLLQWSLHPLRFPRYRGTETLNRNFMLRMNWLTLGILKTSFRLLQWSLHPLRLI